MIALCIGHSRMIGGKRDGGATSADGRVNEWSYNSSLARLIAKGLAVESMVIDSYSGAGYSGAMGWLAGQVRWLDAKLAVELHFNAATGKASGHEWLYWQGSKAGQRVALELHLAVSAAFPGHKGRGCKPRGPADRGAEFLRRTHCPAVIAEPFFGDNPADWALMGGEEGAQKLAAAMAAGLEKAYRTL